jgi:TetR/AcrR family transcriptional repressor of nem operon
MLLVARPREFDERKVIAAAKEVFWRRGYEATGLDEIERATHLSRSSVYAAYGSKRQLFEAALVEYQATFIQGLLGRVEAPGAAPTDAQAFFAEIGSMFRSELGDRGCLMVNAIGELVGRDPAMGRDGREFHARYRRAFANALGITTTRGERRRAVIAQRSEILAVSAMGVWITSRVDPRAAATACDAIVVQIKMWST